MLRNRNSESTGDRPRAMFAAALACCATAGATHFNPELSFRGRGFSPGAPESRLKHKKNQKQGSEKQRKRGYEARISHACIQYIIRLFFSMSWLLHQRGIFLILCNFAIFLALSEWPAAMIPSTNKAIKPMVLTMIGAPNSTTSESPGIRYVRAAIKNT